MTRWSARTASMAAVAASALVAAPAPASAAPDRTVEVVQLAGEELVDGCVGPLRYLSGEVRIRTQIVHSASGGRVVQYSAHTVGATAVSTESGVLYRDHTQDHISNQGNGTWFETDFADGSHGVRIVSRTRLMAPGTDAPRLVVKFDVHLRRVAGSTEAPPLDVERFSYSCA
jgi:hypothetical protein